MCFLQECVVEACVAAAWDASLVFRDYLWGETKTEAAELWFRLDPIYIHSGSQSVSQLVS